MMTLNWVDWIILALLGYYGYQGWQTGFVSLVSNMVAFVASLWLALKYHQPVGQFITEKFGILASWASVAGYVIVALVAETILAMILDRLVDRFPQKFVSSRVNQILGIVGGLTNGLVIIAFFLLLITALPLRGTVRQDMQASTIGSYLLGLIDRYGGGRIQSVVEDVRQEAVKFLTVHPTSKERITLDVSPPEASLRVNKEAETQLLALVNQERARAGIHVLVENPKITAVARGHSRDMFERQYFSHISPEGTDAGDRLTRGGVPYAIAGENLAYAPDVDTAHTGLMNSEGHRKNILDPQFRRAGIGVIDAGPLGMMFTQNFTD